MVKFTQTMESILKAMKIANVQRLITISAWYTDPNTRKGILKNFLDPHIVKVLLSTQVTETMPFNITYHAWTFFSKLSNNVML